MFPRNDSVIYVAVLLILSLVVGSSNFGRSFVGRSPGCLYVDIS